MVNNGGKKWSLSDDIELIKQLNTGKCLNDIAESLNRTEKSILWKIIKNIEKQRYISSKYSSEIYEKLKNIEYFNKMIKRLNIDQQIIADENIEDQQIDIEDDEEEMEIINKKKIIKKLENTITQLKSNLLTIIKSDSRKQIFIIENLIII
jgi:hypothetical protein